MSRIRSSRSSFTALPFDLGSLHVFLMVCENGSMGAAAKALGITQPGVSQAISDLEAGLGRKLFERSVRPLVLTAAGALLRQRAILLMAEAHEVSTALGDSEKGSLFRIRVGLAGSVMRALALSLAKFLSTHASEVVVFSGTTSSHIEGIVNRSVDISISWSGMEDTDWIERHSILEEPYVLLFPSAFQDLREGLTGIASRLPLIRHSARSQTGRDIDRHLRRLGVEIPRFIEFDSAIGVTAAVADGLGWAITTPLSAFEGGLSPRISYREFPAPGFSRHLYLFARKNELSRLPRAVANDAKESLAREVLPSILRHMPWAENRIRMTASS
jgi:DNA-binding transcriptional LysR family regulator